MDHLQRVYRPQGHREQFDWWCMVWCGQSRVVLPANGMIDFCVAAGALHPCKTPEVPLHLHTGKPCLALNTLMHCQQPAGIERHCVLLAAPAASTGVERHCVLLAVSVAAAAADPATVPFPAGYPVPPGPLHSRPPVAGACCQQRHQQQQRPSAAAAVRQCGMRAAAAWRTRHQQQYTCCNSQQLSSKRVSSNGAAVAVALSACPACLTERWPQRAALWAKGVCLGAAVCTDVPLLLLLLLLLLVCVHAAGGSGSKSPSPHRMQQGPMGGPATTNSLPDFSRCVGQGYASAAAKAAGSSSSKWAVCWAGTLPCLRFGLKVKGQLVESETNASST